MEESTIWVYCDASGLDVEYYAETRFSELFNRQVLGTDFATFCIENIDGDTRDHGDIISPYLGTISVHELSGGSKTLLLAYGNKERVYLLESLGDNCAEAIYKSGIGTPTKWLYDGYFPDLLDNQVVYFPETGKTVLGKDIPMWELHDAPDKFWETEEDYKGEPLPPIKFSEEDLREIRKRREEFETDTDLF